MKSRSSRTWDFGCSKWLKCQNKIHSTCRAERQTWVNSVKGFYKGWMGVSTNFPSKDSPVWIFQYCHESQTRGESQPFIQTLLTWVLSCEIWLGDGRWRFVSFIAMETEWQHLIGSSTQLLKRRLEKQPANKFSKTQDKICFRYTFRGGQLGGSVS